MSITRTVKKNPVCFVQKPVEHHSNNMWRKQFVEAEFEAKQILGLKRKERQILNKKHAKHHKIGQIKWQQIGSIIFWRESELSNAPII